MSDDSDDDSSEGVGKGRPPIGSRFKPGQSGNPKGRPRGRKSDDDPYEIILGQMVTVRENGVETQMRADEAFLLQLATKGLGGDGVVARAALDALENRPARSNGAKALQIIVRVYCDAGDLRDAARILQLATVLDPYRPTARLALETWAIEGALARLGDRQLTTEEQEIVFAAARMPHKVRWPDWWTVRSW